MAGVDVTPPEPGPDASVEDIQADIARTREELNHTVAALADKADVKARAQQKVADTKEVAVQHVYAARSTARQHPVVPAAVVLTVLGVLAVVVWRRRR